MNYISWNCRGLGQPCVILELTDLVKKFSPTIIFLMETRSNGPFLQKICAKIHFDNIYIVPRHNSGGSLALFWKKWY